MALPDATTKPLLSVDELLELVPGWPASRSATYRAMSTGDLPSVRIGRRLLLPTAELRRLLGLDDASETAAGADVVEFPVRASGGP